MIDTLLPGLMDQREDWQQFIVVCRPVTGFRPHLRNRLCWCNPELVEVRNASTQQELERLIDRARLLH